MPLTRLEKEATFQPPRLRKRIRNMPFEIMLFALTLEERNVELQLKEKK